jgi:uncharacterized RDD family membrane protein YckC
VAYTSWGRRLVAWLLDFVIVCACVWGLAAAGAFATNDAVVGIVLVPLVGLFAPLYYAFFHAGKRGQTLGKRAVGIAVRAEKKLGRLIFWRSLARAYIVLVFVILWFVPFIVDCLWPLWDPKHQALHDKIVASVVVRTEAHVLATVAIVFLAVSCVVLPIYVLMV